MTRRELTIAGAAVGLLVLAFVVEHFRDAAKDSELVTLHQQLAVDSTLRKQAIARTDTSGAKVDRLTRIVDHTVTLWRTAADSARKNVAAIVASPAPDSTKIRQLAAHVDTLIAKGDSLADVADSLKAAAVKFRVDVSIERASWAKERGDLAKALSVSESRRRHWGLGATLGYGVTRTNDGTVRAGPAVVAGLTYRW